MCTHDVTEHLAESDETATNAFRAAVEACADEGGGTVRVPPGEYLVGSVELVDGLTVRIEAGATVRVSPDESEYERTSEYVGPDGERPWLLARNCRDVSIVGGGTVDGGGTDLMRTDEPIRGHSGESAGLVSNGAPDPRQGDAFLDESDGTEEWPVAKPSFRPGPVVLFDDCANVSVRNVTFRDAPAWTLAVRACDSVRVAGVTVRNHPRIPNCDGVSVENSRNVRVSDCDVRACDDAVTLVARAGGPPCENVVVSNCALSSRACAVKVGSETAADVRNCAVRNCVVYDSNRGLGIQHRDGGDVSNVLFSNVVVETRLFEGPWWGKAEPVYVTSVPRGDSTALGRVENVRFANVVADCENGAVVYGHEDATLKGVRLESVRLHVRGPSPGAAAAVGGNFDLQPTSVRPPIFEHDAPAVHCEGVDGLELVDVSVRWADGVPDYHTHGVACVGVDGLTIDGFDGRPAHSDAGDAAIALRETTAATVRNSRARPGTGAFLAAEGTTDDRLFASNDLTDAEEALAGETGFTVVGNADPRER